MQQEDTTPSNWFALFPVYANIMSFLPVEDICLSRRVCRSFRDANDWTPFWENLIARDFPNYCTIDNAENNIKNCNNKKQTRSYSNNNNNNNENTNNNKNHHHHQTKKSLNLDSLLHAPPFRARFLHDFGDIFFNEGRAAYAFVQLAHRFPCMMADISNRSRAEHDFDIPVPHTWRHSVAFEINNFVEPIFACATFDATDYAEIQSGTAASWYFLNKDEYSCGAAADKKNGYSAGVYFDNEIHKLPPRLQFLRIVTLGRRVAKSFLSHHKSKDQQILAAVGRIGFTEDTNSYDRRGTLVRDRRNRGRGRGGAQRGRGGGANNNNNNRNDDDDNEDSGHDGGENDDDSKKSIKSVSIRLLAPKLGDTPLMLLADLLYLVPQFYKCETGAVSTNGRNLVEQSLENRGFHLYDSRPYYASHDWDGTETRNNLLWIIFGVLVLFFANPVTGMFHRFHASAYWWDQIGYRSSFNPSSPYHDFNDSLLNTSLPASEYKLRGQQRAQEQILTVMGLGSLSSASSSTFNNSKNLDNENKTSYFRSLISSWSSYFDENNNTNTNSDNETQQSLVVENNYTGYVSWADYSSSFFKRCFDISSFLVTPLILSIAPDIHVQEEVQDWWQFGFQNTTSSNNNETSMFQNFFYFNSGNPDDVLSVHPVNFASWIPNAVFHIVYFPFDVTKSVFWWFVSFIFEQSEEQKNPFITSQIALGWCPNYPILSSPSFLHPPLFLRAFWNRAQDSIHYDSLEYFPDKKKTAHFACYNRTRLINYLRVPPLTAVAHRCPRSTKTTSITIDSNNDNNNSNDITTNSSSSSSSILTSWLGAAVELVSYDIPGAVSLFCLKHGFLCLFSSLFGAVLMEFLINYSHRRNRLLPRPKIAGLYGIDRDLHWFSIIMFVGIQLVLVAIAVFDWVTSLDFGSWFISASSNNTSSEIINASETEASFSATTTPKDFYISNAAMIAWCALPLFLLMTMMFQIQSQMTEIVRHVGGYFDRITCVTRGLRRDFPSSNFFVAQLPSPTTLSFSGGRRSPSTWSEEMTHTTPEGYTFQKKRLLNYTDDEHWSWDDRRFKIPQLQNVISMCFAASHRFYNVPTSSNGMMVVTNKSESHNNNVDDDDEKIEELVSVDQMLAKGKERFFQTIRLRQKQHKDAKRQSMMKSKNKIHNDDHEGENKKKKEVAAVAKKSPADTLANNLKMKRIWLGAMFMSHVLQCAFIFTVWSINMSIIWVIISPVLIVSLLEEFGKNWEGSDKKSQKFVSFVEKGFDWIFGV